jgi:hypothetical protein
MGTTSAGWAWLDKMPHDVEAAILACHKRWTVDRR